MDATHVKNRHGQLKEMLTDPHAYATTLLAAALDILGPEALTWAPETLLLELKQETSIELPPLNADKLMASLSILTSNDFYASLPDFIAIGEALNGNGYNPVVQTLLDVEEAAWAITEAALLDPETAAEGALDEEIPFYLGAILADEGYVSPPRPLRAAQGMKDPMNEFADDPDMYSMLYGAQRDQGRELEQWVVDNVQALFDQLERLPLRNGDSKNLRDRLKLFQ